MCRGPHPLSSGWRRWTAPLLVAVLAACEGRLERAPAAAEPAPAAHASAAAAPAAGTELPARPVHAEPGQEVGFVVWESNRDGAWRIWRQELAGGAPRPLTPAEPGREHCCAKLSPDGRRMVYLSLPQGKPKYRAEAGALHLADADGGRDRVIVPAARHYGEHRAAVWWGPDEIVHLDAEGATIRRVLSTGETEILARPGANGEGWLLAPGGKVASSNTPTFSEFERGGGVSERPSLGGCQPAFSSDGRRAVWSAGAGGPIDAIDLESRRSWTLLTRNDPRLPAGRGYLYFPMLSADETLLAVAGSNGDHDHFTADYDILLLEIDPATLEPRGDARVLAPHPAVDRFPDPFRAPPSTTAARRGGPAAETRAPEPSRIDRGRVLVWERGDALNRVSQKGPGTILRPTGAAWLDRDRAMALAGGRFVADAETGARLVRALQESNQLSLALRLAPASLEQDATILALSGGGRQRAFLLRQRGRSLELLLRTSDTPREGRALRVAELASTRPVAVVLTFSPGRLSVHVDGAATVDSVPFPGDFFSWKSAPLTFGSEPGESTTWRGTLSDVTVWNRPLSPAEAKAHRAAIATRHSAGAAVERAVVEARVLRTSPAPALARISPYREALAVDEIEVVRALSGAPLAPGTRLRRVRWAILDETPLPVPRAGAVERLALEPFEAQPQLEPFYLADELGGSDAPLWFDLGASVER